MTPDVITQAGFATGRILHQGTGKPVLGDIRITAKEGPVIDKVLEDGTFVLSGYLELLFPNLNSQDYDLNLTIRAQSPQYRQGFFEHQLTVTIPMGSEFDPDPPVVPDPLVEMGTILLPTDSITIRGRVVEAENPNQPIAGATVEILHAGPAVAPQTANAEGRYSFDDVAVTAPTQIRCASPPNFKTVTRVLLLDFGKLVNEENFRLPPV